jgi:adenosine deaminase
MSQLDRSIIQRMPKVVLHDHLDGGLRPETVLELAAEQGVELPESEPEALRRWFLRGANRGSLSQYLEGFGVTISVMQTRDALERVAYEALADLHAEGVVYAEQRFAPQYHDQGGMNLEEVIDAVISGFERAEAEFGIRWGLLVCGMRSDPPEVSHRMAELAISFRTRGCLGFDLAGDELGHPPKDHLDAFHLCQRENFNITIHAGEAFGPRSIWQALQYCGAHRIGHGTRLIEDMAVQDGKVLKMGDLAGYVLDHRIPMEVCLTSNLQTGAVERLEEHPFKTFLRYRFRVTLNTDNRLMSGVTMTDELQLAHDAFSCDFEVLEKLIINGAKSAFLPYDQRTDIIYERLKPRFAEIRRELGLPERLYPRR